MIRTFADHDTARVVARERPRRLPGKLQKLHGSRQGRYSIRINDQWRLCFAWRDGDAYDATIVDYH